MDPPLPEWTDPFELLHNMTGGWQPLSRSLTQQETLDLGPLVIAGLIEYRFEVEAESIDVPACALWFNIVASGEYGPHLDQFMQAQINKLLPPNRHVNVRRRLGAIRRTAWGMDCVQSGWPPLRGLLTPPSMRVCDVRRQVPASAGRTDDQDQMLPVAVAPEPSRPIAAEQGPSAPPFESGNVAPKKSRMSSTEIDARVVNYLLRFHGYDEGRIGNSEPAEQKRISDETHVPEPTISGRFKKWFGGRDAYVAKCRSGNLGPVLQRIMNEASSWQGSDVLDSLEGQSDHN
jgi:hypothetical protein